MCAREIAKPKYEIVGKLERFNEADNAQARGELEPDSHRWQEYYKKHHELESVGRAWLKLPGLGNVGPLQDWLFIVSMFRTIDFMSNDDGVDGSPSPDKIVLSPERAVEKIEGFARLLGADLVRIGPLNPAWVYSHVGRSHFSNKPIGPEINLPHNSAIVVAHHLNLDMLRCAPELGELIDILKNYLHLANIVGTLASYIRSLGYSARAHDLCNYQILITPVAIDAGLGELGRNGVLITEEYGNAVKMAAVTTDMPLVHDKPVDIGVDEFCRDCNICAEYCPVGAIPMHQEKRVVRGVRKWKINENACYGYWRTVGTDCGICLSVCPWSRSRHFPHNLVLKGVQKSSLIRKLAIQADHLIPRKRTKSPAWFEEQPNEWINNLRHSHPFKR